jgi:hypothetical protein
MNQTEFEDRCSECKKPTTRVRRREGRYVTACCAAPPLAVPVVKE